MVGDPAMAYDALDTYGTAIAGGFDHSEDLDAPKAYLNILLFDKSYNLVDAAYKQIGIDHVQTDVQTNNGVKADHGYLSREMIVPEAGYAYIFLSNENPTQVDVYFDDIKVIHSKSPVVQMDDYYPFGLTFNSYQRENSISQDFKFNGKEEQNELTLGWLDFGARMYQPEIGRWGINDPKAESYESGSPYAYAFDNPIRFIDIQGQDPGDVVIIFDGADLSSSSPPGIGPSLANGVNINGGNTKHFNGEFWTAETYQGQYGLVSSFRRIDMNSEKDLDVATQAAYDYVKESRKNNKDGRFVIYGYSWGGVLANHLAKRLKDQVDDTDFLIIVDAANGGKSDEVDRDYSNSADRVDNYYTPDRSNFLDSHGDKGKPEEKVNNKIRVTYKDENGKKKTVTHSNIDEATFDEVLKSINEFLNN